MNVFVAGGSGTIGKPLVRALIGAGHQVTALTRSPHQRSELLALGASVAVADALNRDALVPRLVSPYMSRLMSAPMPLSNVKAKLELGWCPAFPTLEDGLADMFRRVVR